jgi:hypothetical protein
MAIFSSPKVLTVLLATCVVGCNDTSKQAHADPAASRLAAIRGHLLTCQALSKESPVPYQSIIDFLSLAAEHVRRDPQSALSAEAEKYRVELQRCFQAIEARLKLQSARPNNSFKPNPLRGSA